MSKHELFRQAAFRVMDHGPYPATSALAQAELSYWRVAYSVPDAFAAIDAVLASGPVRAVDHIGGKLYVRP